MKNDDYRQYGYVPIDDRPDNTTGSTKRTEQNNLTREEKEILTKLLIEKAK